MGSNPPVPLIPPPGKPVPPAPQPASRPAPKGDDGPTAEAVRAYQKHGGTA